MPARAAHEQRARENEDFVIHRLDMRIDVNRSWMVAALFYAALHWVEAYFASQGKHAKNHGQREAMIVADAALGQGFWRLYGTLSDRSQDARYELKVFSPAEVNDLQVRHLAAIKRHIASLLP